jgi:hypothetical protein
MMREEREQDVNDGNYQRIFARDYPPAAGIIYHE